MNNYSMAELLLCISDKQWTGPNGDNVHFVLVTVFFVFFSVVCVCVCVCVYLK